MTSKTQGPLHKTQNTLDFRWELGGRVLEALDLRIAALNRNDNKQAKAMSTFLSHGCIGIRSPVRVVRCNHVVVLVTLRNFSRDL